MPLFISKASDPLLLPAERPSRLAGIDSDKATAVCMFVWGVCRRSRGFERTRVRACVRAPVRACVREVFAIYDNTI